MSEECTKPNVAICRESQPCEECQNVLENKKPGVQLYGHWYNCTQAAENRATEVSDLFLYDRLLKHVEMEKGEARLNAIIQQLGTHETFTPTQVTKLLNDYDAYLADPGKEDSILDKHNQSRQVLIHWNAITAAAEAWRSEEKFQSGGRRKFISPKSFAYKKLDDRQKDLWLRAAVVLMDFNFLDCALDVTQRAIEKTFEICFLEAPEEAQQTEEQEEKEKQVLAATDLKGELTTLQEAFQDVTKPKNQDIISIAHHLFTALSPAYQTLLAEKLWTEKSIDEKLQLDATNTAILKSLFRPWSTFESHAEWSLADVKQIRAVVHGDSQILWLGENNTTTKKIKNNESLVLPSTWLTALLREHPGSNYQVHYDAPGQTQLRDQNGLLSSFLNFQPEKKPYPPANLQKHPIPYLDNVLLVRFDGNLHNKMSDLLSTLVNSKGDLKSVNATVKELMPRKKAWMTGFAQELSEQAAEEHRDFARNWAQAALQQVKIIPFPAASKSKKGHAENVKNLKKFCTFWLHFSFKFTFMLELLKPGKHIASLKNENTTLFYEAMLKAMENQPKQVRGVSLAEASKFIA